jgi:hypothetical protein
MKKLYQEPLLIGVILTLALSLGAMAFDVRAQDDTKAAMKKDKTGTNPINFTNDMRVYNEFSWLNTEGDGEKNVTTFEYRMPILEGKLQFRIRIRGVWTQADLNNDGIDDLDSSGLGEVDFRFLTVPYLNMKKKVAMAIGFETFLPTGNPTVGSQRLSIGPQIFGVFFMPFGIKNSLIAPAYQHRVSTWEDEGVSRLNQSLFDVFFLLTSADKQYWMLVNPSYVIDHETEADFGFVDAEFGMMLDNIIGPNGHSVYIRPSIGIGEDHPTDGSIEVGYKVIW